MKYSKDNIINLEDFRVKRSTNEYSKVFTGRDRGVYVRTESKIDNIEGEYDKIIIIIPKDIRSINPSFFEELFKNVVIKLGKDGFLSKFEFHSEGTYNVQKPLAEAIQRILRKDTAIG
jgi:hypothetical protein